MYAHLTPEHVDMRTLEATPPVMHVVGDSEAIRTIWFALDSYKSDLVEDARRARNADSVEDEAFLHDVIAQISRIQFEIRDNHDATTGEADRVRKWLDV